MAVAAAQPALAPVLGARAVSPERPTEPLVLAGLLPVRVALRLAPAALRLAPVEFPAVVFRPGDSG